MLISQIRIFCSTPMLHGDLYMKQRVQYLRFQNSRLIILGFQWNCKGQFLSHCTSNYSNPAANGERRLYLN